MLYRPFLALACLAAVTVAPNVQALQFQFIVDFTSGPLSGQTGQGQFDTTFGNGFKTVANGGLLSFTFSVGGEDFTSSDDGNYPSFPAINAFAGGTSIVGLEFFSSAGPDGGALELTFLSNPFVSEANYTPAGGRTSSGVFRSAPNLVALPDSGTTSLSLATAIAGMAMLRRRAQRQ